MRRREEDEKAWLRLLELEPGLVVPYFKERPEELARLYVADKQFREMIKMNPHLVFEIVVSAFPDIINRLYFALEIARDPRLMVQRSDINIPKLVASPFLYVNRGFIDHRLLRECAENEAKARQTAKLSAAIEPSTLPHAQYCFVSTFKSSLLLYKIDTLLRARNTDDTLLKRFSLLLGRPLSQTKLYVSPVMLSTILMIWTQYKDAGDRPLDKLTFGRCEGALLSGEPGTFSIPTDRKDITIYTYENGLNDNQMFIHERWLELSLDNLRALLSSPELPEEMGRLDDEAWLRKRADLLEEVRAAIDEVPADDPLMHTTYDETTLDRIYRLREEIDYSPDGDGFWYSVLRAKLQFMRFLEKTTGKPQAIFDAHGNGHLIFQCHICGESTTKVSRQTDLAFCNSDCESRWEETQLHFSK